MAHWIFHRQQYWCMTPPTKAQIHSHRDLIVWQRAMQLVKETYRVTAGLPSHELYGLASQMRRAAVSIAANIAEGQARGATRDFPSDRERLAPGARDVLRVEQ